jgi:hypothetical protein
VPFVLDVVLLFFNGVFVRFSTRCVQKRHKSFLEKVRVKNKLQKNVPVIFFLQLVYRVFFPVFLHERPKTQQK